MSSHKANRSRMAEYQIMRDLAEQSSAMETLNITLDALDQEGIAKVVRRAFESVENLVASESGEEKA